MLGQAGCALSLTEILHLTFGKVGTIIRDDAVWKAKTEDNLFEKLNRRSCITLANRLLFNPTSWCSLQWDHKPGFDASQDFLISSFCLPIGLGVSH